jgi:hypothetical protein
MGLVLASLDRLEARVERVDGRMAGLNRTDSRLERLEARTEQLEQGVTRLRVDLMDHLDGLQSVRNDVIVN